MIPTLWERARERSFAGQSQAMLELPGQIGGSSAGGDAVYSFFFRDTNGTFTPFEG